MDSRTFTLRMEDGRDLQIVLDGPPDGQALVFHSGTPSGAVSFPLVSGPAAAAGLRTVTWSRPGYGGSTTQPGRAVADVVGDTAAVLAELGRTAS